MSLWGNVDTQAAKPKLPEERLFEQRGLVVAVSQTSNNAIINVGTYGSLANVEGYFTAGNPVSGNNVPAGANVVSYDGANTLLTISANTTANVIVGDVITLGLAINYNSNVANTYNADTILVTTTRMANAVVNVAHTHSGWSHIVKKVNNDGSVRYLEEVMVVLANSVASNAASGNTSAGQIYSGV